MLNIRKTTAGDDNYLTIKELVMLNHLKNESVIQPVITNLSDSRSRSDSRSHTLRPDYIEFRVYIP